MYFLFPTLPNLFFFNYPQNTSKFAIVLGHPQVIKVVQSTANKALGGIVSTTNAGGLKVFKTPSQESQVK